MLVRRLLLLVAVLLGLTALAASIAPPQQLPGGLGGPSPEASPAAPAPAQPRTIARTISADGVGRPARVRARVGDTVELTVRSNRIDSVEVDDLAGAQAVEGDSPAQFEILADTPGRYPITFEDSGRRIGTLDVVP